jgi:hypothetical protein
MAKQCRFKEKNCVFNFKGKTFKSDGAQIIGDHIIAYLGKNGELTAWKGKKIGTYRFVSSWATPNSYISSRMYQVEAMVNGKVYTGRSAGAGMIFKGKIKKGRK